LFVKTIGKRQSCPVALTLRARNLRRVSAALCVP
jgi:hypothetical protein